MSELRSFAHNPALPFDPEVAVYDCRTRGRAMPMEFSGWKDEAMSGKETCYLYAGLNPAPTYRVTGPDCVALLSSLSINGFDDFAVGTARQVVMCGQTGDVMAHGTCLRLAHRDFVTYWLAPYLQYKLETSDLDVEGEDLTGKVFVFEVAGPRSLEVLERATGEDLRGIAVLGHRESEIAGAEVGVLRSHVAGTLAYEVHGQLDDAHTVYNAILEAGQPSGLRRLGELAFPLNHTEGGFPQSYNNFPLAWAQDDALMEFVEGRYGSEQARGHSLTGSMDSDLASRYCNPVELGWRQLIAFDHDFVGRAALEREAADPRRTIVTLVWDHEDILDVYRSQFAPGAEHKLVEFPLEPTYKDPRTAIANDRVLKGDHTIGMTMGRMYSYRHREMISTCRIDVDHSEIGTAVEVLWGEPGTRQKLIGATVARHPYLDLERN